MNPSPPIPPTESTDREQSGLELSRRLAWLVDKPDGILFSKRRPSGGITVEKVGPQIHLRFFSDETTEIQSRIDPANPLHLVSPYTRAMLLSILWRPEPSLVHVIGLGGARIPMVLHHHFPGLTIECTEIDADVPDLAAEFFGFQADSRLRLIMQDARAYLAARSADALYDIIMVDAFNGVGFGPVPLATIEFYEICRRQLLPGGLVVVNILPHDELGATRLRTIMSSFQNVYTVTKDGTTVVFAYDGEPVEKMDLLMRAVELDGRHRFSFALSSMAAGIGRPLDRRPELGFTKEPPLLTDAFSPRSVHIDANILKHIGRNELCPCGSGKKYKKCHGLA